VKLRHHLKTDLTTVVSHPAVDLRPQGTMGIMGTTKTSTVKTSVPPLNLRERIPMVTIAVILTTIHIVQDLDLLQLRSTGLEASSMPCFSQETRRSIATSPLFGEETRTTPTSFEMNALRGVKGVINPERGSTKWATINLRMSGKQDVVTTMNALLEADLFRISDVPRIEAVELQLKQMQKRLSVAETELILSLPLAKSDARKVRKATHALTERFRSAFRHRTDLPEPEAVIMIETTILELAHEHHHQDKSVDALVHVTVILSPSKRGKARKAKARVMERGRRKLPSPRTRLRKGGRMLDCGIPRTSRMRRNSLKSLWNFTIGFSAR